MSTQKVTVVFPMAAHGGRFGYKFKPFVEIGTETFVEAAVRPFVPKIRQIEKLVFICLDEHEREFDVARRLRSMFPNLPVETVQLAQPTHGPAETVVQAIQKAGLDGPAFICDVDHSIGVGPLFSAISDGPLPDSLLPVWSLDGQELKAWSVAAISGHRVTSIAEKRLPDAPGEFVGVIGCYFFRQLERLPTLFEPGAHTHLSHILAKMLRAGGDVRAVRVTDAEFFGDPRKLRSVRARRDIHGGAIFCDIDGVLVEHEDEPRYDRPLRLLPGAREKLTEWIERGYMIILSTARRADSEEQLRRAIASAGLPYHRLVMGLPSGPRFLVNDRKPSAALVAQAAAFEVERNQGVAHLSIRSAYPTVKARFHGGSFAETLLIEDEEKLFVRKRVFKRDNLSLGYSKLRNQYRTMDRFSRLVSSLVPALYGESDNSYDYSYDMAYLPEHQLLSRCSPADQLAGLERLFECMEEHVYRNDRVSRSGDDWLSTHLANKVYSKLDAMQAHPRLFSLVASDVVEIDGVSMPGLRELLARASSHAGVQRFAPGYLSTVHGDLTFENILYAPPGGNGDPADVRVIDMDGADYVDAPELDLGKLFQSLYGRYEEWAHGKERLFESVDGRRFVRAHRPQAPDPELERRCVRRWAAILSTSEDQVRLKGWFYLGLHLIRMVPFRLSVSEEQALFALCGAVVWLSRSMELLG